MDQIPCEKIPNLINIVIIYGVPCSGKSTLSKFVQENLLNNSISLLIEVDKIEKCLLQNAEKFEKINNFKNIHVDNE